MKAIKSSFIISIIAIAWMLFWEGALQAAEKKVIEIGWDIPDTAFVRANIKKMEMLPFDGVVILPRGRDDSGKIVNQEVTWPFSKHPFKREWFRNCVDDLKATKFTTLTDNFILANAYPGELEWFNDAHWQSACSNMAILAWVAKEGGLKGICFDPESYRGKPFAYCSQLYHGSKSFGEYRQQARKRGRDVMQAIAAEYPDITILLLFGSSLTYQEALEEGKTIDEGMKKGYYGLLSSFIDGMLDAIPEGANLVDGYEGSYYYKTKGEFLEGYHLIKNKTLEIVPADLHRKYCSQVQAGFGLYMDQKSGWFAGESSKNVLQPEAFKKNVKTALLVSDRYIWIWSERPNWWGTEKPGWQKTKGDEIMPEPYVKALKEAKEEYRLNPSELTSWIINKPEPPKIKRKPSTLSIPMLKKDILAPVIDGDISDKAWPAGAYIGNFVLYQPGNSSIQENKFATQVTEAYACYDEKNIYIAFRCHEDKMESIAAKVKNHDGSVWQDDCVDIFIDTGIKDVLFYHFILNSMGTKWDAKSWAQECDPSWEGAARVNKKFWTAEIAIPFASVEVQPKANMILRVNLGREEQPHNEVSSWVPTNDFQDREQFGTWSFAEGMREGNK